MINKAHECQWGLNRRWNVNDDSQEAKMTAMMAMMLKNEGFRQRRRRGNDDAGSLEVAMKTANTQK